MDMGAKHRATEITTKPLNQPKSSASESAKLRAVTDKIFENTEKFGSLSR
jgi:hypothetical protein